MEAAETQISMQKQLTANKRLDFELARLKNCGEQMKKYQSVILSWSYVSSKVTILCCMC